jgi:hypothetical protein
VPCLGTILLSFSSVVRVLDRVVRVLDSDEAPQWCVCEPPRDEVAGSMWTGALCKDRFWVSTSDLPVTKTQQAGSSILHTPMICVGGEWQRGDAFFARASW